MIDSYSSRHPRQQMTSRRAKNEQDKLLKQTIVLTVSAIAFLVLSFFVIIPGVIRFIGGFSPAGTETEDNTLPPQVPILSAPATATPSATITLQGFTSKNAEVVVVKNGQEDKHGTADDQGKFAIAVTLNKGENKFSLYAKNASKESASSQEYTTILDNEAPSLEVTEPQENQTIEGKKNQNVTVKGKTDPHTKVLLNDRLIFAQADGTFSSTFRLENGANTLTFKAIDDAGNVTEKSFTVNFRE